MDKLRQEIDYLESKYFKDVYNNVKKCFLDNKRDWDNYGNYRIRRDSDNSVYLEYYYKGWCSVLKKIVNQEKGVCCASPEHIIRSLLISVKTAESLNLKIVGYRDAG